MTVSSTPLRVVLFREQQFWLAQVLEHDVGAQGEDLKDLLCRLELAVAAEGEGMSQLPPAPKYFQDLWPLKAGTFRAQSGACASFELGIVA